MPEPPRSSDEPAGRGCDLWWARPDQAGPRLLALLDRGERQRYEGLRQPVDRDRFVVAAALLRLAAAHELGRSPDGLAVGRACPDCPRPHGRPTLPGTGLEVSVSHSGDRVLVALTRLAPVGVDVERIRGVDADALAGRVLGPAESRALEGLSGDGRITGFFTYWTRKESVLKATGDGLRAAMDGVRVSAPDEPPRLLAYAGRDELVGAAGMADLAPGPGYAGALTVLVAGPVRLREHDAADLLRSA